MNEIKNNKASFLTREFYLALFFMKYPRFPKRIYAVGNNKESARLSGINVDWTVVLTYTMEVAN